MLYGAFSIYLCHQISTKVGGGREGGGGNTPTPFSSLSPEANNIMLFISFFYRTKWIVIYGTKYKEDDFVLWKFDGDVPIFARIKAIVLPELSEPKFVIFPLVTAVFSAHFHSYEVVYRLSPPNYMYVVRLILSTIMYLVCTNHTIHPQLI